MTLRITLPSVLLILGLGSACTPGLQTLEVKNGNSIVHYPGDGGVVISNVRYEGKTICVAPPAQGVRLTRTTVNQRGKVDVAGYVGVDMGLDVDTVETLARLYEQNERTLFLQYSLYRLCEAYMNGILTTASAHVIIAEQAREANAKVQQLTTQKQLCEEEKQRLDDERSALNQVEAADSETNKKKKKAIEERIAELDCRAIEADIAGAHARATTLDAAAKKASESDLVYDAGLVYWDGFNRIMATAVELAKVDAEQAKLRAEVRALEAKAEADKQTKAAADAKAKMETATKELDRVRKDALDAAIECTDCKKKENTKDKAKDEPSTGAD